MCGRIEYHITSRKKLEERYDATLIEGYTERGVINARYNIPPSSIVPILTSEEPHTIVPAHWGYLPSWAKRGKNKEVINARAESILEKPYFRSAIRARRCLIPVTGFYEWHRENNRKTPYRFYTDDEIFSLAGLYTPHEDMRGTMLPHFAIVTTSANSVMAPVHDRMPVILDKNDEEHWLEEEMTDEALTHLMRPFVAAHTHADQISTLVNNPRNDSPEIIKPVK